MFNFLGSLQAFRSQTKFQTKYNDILRQRDSLRDIFPILSVVDIKSYQGWEDTTEIQDLDQRVASAKTLFNDDDELSKALTLLGNLIGSDANTLRESGLEQPMASTIKIREILTTKISSLEKHLYG